MLPILFGNNFNDERRRKKNGKELCLQGFIENNSVADGAKKIGSTKAMLEQKGLSGF